MFLIFLLFVTAVSCTSKDDEFGNISVETRNADIVYSFDLTQYLDAISSLDSLESIEVPVKVLENDNLYSKTSTRSGEITPIVGTVTNLGNKQTLFRYGIGENLVPSYYCGNNLNYMTISTVYKVSIRYDLNDDYDVKGYIGEYSGWNGTYVNNPQTRWQGKNGDTNYSEFYTYVYDIKATIQGYSAGEHCWVPVNVNDVRIYTKIMQ